MTDRTIRLYSACLWDKYGFGDGDQLSTHFLNIGDGGQLLDALEGSGLIDSDVLVELVKRRLLPVLNVRVELPIWHTVHNPARVDDERFPKPEVLTPELIEVTEGEVLALAREMAATSPPSSAAAGKL